MIGEIKVVSGNRKRFVEYCHYFISEIDKSIKEEGADKEGTLVSIGWSPNRLLQLRYLGDSTYEIEKSENSKLQPGDRFVTGCFIKEQPLFLPYIERGGERTASFVAGRNGGLTVISINEK